tara:strand:- start:144 stop:467 length:324 start_codon:yes stop_codon:yes gene_type:complete
MLNTEMFFGKAHPILGIIGTAKVKQDIVTSREMYACEPPYFVRIGDTFVDAIVPEDKGARFPRKQNLGLVFCDGFLLDKPLRQRLDIVSNVGRRSTFFYVLILARSP